MSAIKQLIPHLFTAGNLVGGIMAIIFTLEGRIDLAPWCILISAVLDFLDGFIARLLNVQSELGKQLDSLADMVTFGVAPGVMVYHFYEWSLFMHGIHKFHYLSYSAILLPVFALFRLAKFNLNQNQSHYFLGLPTPAMTIFFVPLTFGMSSIELATKSEFQVLSVLGQPIILTALILFFSILMVIPLPLFALKFKSFGWKGNEIRYVFLAVSAILLATLWWWGLPIIIVLYVLLSIVHNLISRKGAKAQTLE